MKPGIERLDADEYHGDPCPEPSLSSTIAKILMAKAPIHAWTASPRLNPDYEPIDTKTFDLGRAAHRVTLGAGDDIVAIPESMLSKDGAANTSAAKAFIADARDAGLTPLKPDEVETIEAMHAKLELRLQQYGIRLNPRRSEMAAYGQIDGVWCRAMMDNAPMAQSEPLYDFKTTTDANPEVCLRAVAKFQYDLQDAHYRETWKAATGEDRRFRFIFQEKTAPFEICVIELGPETQWTAAKKIRRARQMWRNCLTVGDWPGYPIGVHFMELPDWHHANWLERESVEAEHERRTGRDALDRARHWQSPENDPEGDN